MQHRSSTPLTSPARMLLTIAGVSALAAAAHGQVFSNGSTGLTPAIVTDPGIGPFAGNNASQATASVNTAGSTATGNFRLADDFTLTAPTSVTHVGVFAYMTGTYSGTPTSPFTGVDVRIWSGMPNAPGSSIVASSSTMFSTSWTGITRHFDGALTTASRPVMEIVADFGGQSLDAGTYWLDYAVIGQLGSSSTAFTPFVMSGQGPDRTTISGNAMQLSAGQWRPIGAGDVQQGVELPFYVVPAPAAAVVFGLGGLLMTRRRR
jgi:hypothetical protein